VAVTGAAGRRAHGWTASGARRKGGRLQVTIEPFAGPPPAWVRRAAEAEAERLAASSGGQLELRWTDAG
jgi:hypothetical protein